MSTKNQLQKLKDELNTSRAELNLLHEVSNAMRTTLKLNEILYIILTAITFHEGLGFNRAMLFLVNKSKNILEGVMGIGPHSGEEADKIWHAIEARKMTLDDLIGSYHKFRSDPESKLNSIVKTIKIPLTEKGGILALTILEGMPFEVTTEEAKNQARDKIQEILKTEYFIIVPLKAKDKIIGAILADNIFTKNPITKSDVRMLSLFANHAGLAIENSRLYEETLHLSNSDWLTKLCNHGHFQYLLSSHLEKAKELETELSLIMLDIDYFKNYNDILGHPAGDRALKKLSTILKAELRKTDFACRYGGEEFAIIMPGADKSESLRLAERLRKAVEKAKFPKQDVQPEKKFTISCGVATFPEDAKDKSKLIQCADLALYKAKKEGKNRSLLYNKTLKKL